jgi:hypothetical protein
MKYNYILILILVIISQSKENNIDYLTALKTAYD